jgi:ABC-type proline/glycine betaine transport system substrate-binding protein
MKTLSLAVITGLLLAISVPAFAQDAPKTKADCDKAKGSWDEKTMTCTVKK